MQLVENNICKRRPTMFLPHELIIQILLRLPVKSLIRFKCVCKSWFSLISHDSHFANSHFQLTSATPTRRILLISNSTRESRSIDFEASPASVSLNNLDCIFPKDFTDFEVIGSCRGFILICGSLNMYLWNPTTGVHKQIPLSSFGSNFYAHYFYGFEYDHSTEDYLVVSMSIDTDADVISSHLEIFSLRANAWKQIEGTCFPYMNVSLSHNPRGSLFSGAIHWLALHSEILTSVIVAFDLNERKFLEMSVPDDFDAGPNYCDSWVFGEFLSVWCMGNDTIEIWVMKEYKVHSSWTMTLLLQTDAIPTHNFSPIYCTNSGDIIGTDDSRGLVKYDDRGRFLEHRSYGINQHGFFEVAMYVESLLSLPIDSLKS